MTASSTTSAKLDTLTNAVNKNRTNCGHHYTEHHSMFNNTQTIPRKRSISPAEGHVHHLRKRANIRSRHALVILLVESTDVMAAKPIELGKPDQALAVNPTDDIMTDEETQVVNGDHAGTKGRRGIVLI
eukprot:622667_1